jgi:DNA ligase (NAD+)
MNVSKPDTGKLNRIEALEQTIKEYQASYYNGYSEISDTEFDLLWDKLQRIKRDSPVLIEVGADHVDGFPKVKHIIPMGSQDKAANADEFRAWATKINPKTFVVQYKLDGASLELQYAKGKLMHAVTRGNGVVGDDITQNALQMTGVVAQLDIPFDGGIRGEVVMTHQVWNDKYSTKANCRNAANGLMRRKDGVGCDDLTLITYDATAIGNDHYFQNELTKIEWLTKRGFLTAITTTFASPDEVIAYKEVLAKERDTTLAIDIDGLVIKDITIDMLDLRRVRPERQIAFKFELEVAYSVLRAVEWSESGTTYTPVGIIDPVHLAGTTVQRANLNNPNAIRLLHLKIGSVISIVKRGEIIPKIEGLAPEGILPGDRIETPIEFPNVCSTCGTTLIDEGTRLYCPNMSCDKRLLHRLEKWVMILDIREVGEKLIRQLYEANRVKRIPDLYSISVEELSKFERMGRISAVKVIRHIHTKREIPLSYFVAGFDFDSVGRTIMEKVVSTGFNTLELLRAASLDDLTAIYGIGQSTARTLMEGLIETFDEMNEVLALDIISIALPPNPDAMPLKGLSFCFTGELHHIKRSEAEERVKALGAMAKSSVVKGLSYLVTNDTGSGSAKNKKAQELGIPIIDEAEFLIILNDPKKIQLA